MGGHLKILNKKCNDQISTFKGNFSCHVKTWKHGWGWRLLLRVLAGNKDGLNGGDFRRFGAKWVGPRHLLEKKLCESYCTVEI